MKWQGRPGSSNIEDRRGSVMRGGAGLGIGGLLIVMALSWATGTDLTSLLNGGGPLAPASSSESGPVASTPEEERTVDFVAAVAGLFRGPVRADIAYVVASADQEHRGVPAETACAFDAPT